MIVYNLLCYNAHAFEGWFSSAEAYARQQLAGQIACPVCGSSDVEKQLSAPHVHTRSMERGERERAETVMANPALMEKLRLRVMEYIFENTEDVGERFPEEARAIFHEQAPERAIRGKATAREASDLREEGIEVFSVPVGPNSKEKLH